MIENTIFLDPVRNLVRFLFGPFIWSFYLKNNKQCIIELIKIPFKVKN